MKNLTLQAFSLLLLASQIASCAGGGIGDTTQGANPTPTNAKVGINDDAGAVAPADNLANREALLLTALGGGYITSGSELDAYTLKCEARAEDSGDSLESTYSARCLCPSDAPRLSRWYWSYSTARGMAAAKIVQRSGVVEGKSQGIEARFESTTFYASPFRAFIYISCM
ncbi:MAG: hypothetical protein AAGL17_16675 [Cyanobacteria bacterium J06576_12]